MNKGVALITAMMVMSLATITAVQMTSEQQIYFHRTENILLHEQAYLYLLSAEDFTKLVLAEDFRGNESDSFVDAWFSEQPVIFPVEGGTLTGSVNDLQGKININNLAKDSRDPWDEQRLRQALQNNDISQDLASIIIDWLDKNTEALPGGAEDIDYLAGDRPYRASNGMMGSISELRLLKGVDEEIYESLENIFVALPATDITININTAPPAVLRVIVEGLSDTDAEELAKDLAENPLKEPDQFLDHPLVKDRKVDMNGLGTESSYFLLDSMATVSRARAKMQTILYRQDDKNIKVVMRSQGGL
ncbi:MAG: type II secretion system minor pseudopilin GspK [Thioalkalispiraceae bacterium]